MDIVQLVESEIVLCIDVVNGEYETYGECDTVSNVDRYASLLYCVCATLRRINMILKKAPFLATLKKLRFRIRIR